MVKGGSLKQKVKFSTINPEGIILTIGLSLK